MGQGDLDPHENVSEPDLPPREPLPHTEEDVLAALAELSDTDIRYLADFARRRILGIRCKADEADADDLFSEAVTLTLRHFRKWKLGVSFRNHLIGCMRSIANGRFKRARILFELPPDHPDACPAPERILDAKAQVERLRAELGQDAVAQEVLTTLFDGLMPKQAVEILQMRDKVYQAARKRIRRLAEKLFGAPNEARNEKRL